MNCSRILTALFLSCTSVQIFAGESTNADCPPELKAQYIAEIKKPILTESEIAKYAALLPLLQTSEPNVPEDVIKQFQELESKLNGVSAAIAEKYPSCAP